MRRHRVVMVLAGAAAAWCAVPLAVSAAPAAQPVGRAGTWGTAIEVPGLRALNQGGRAALNSVSCGSPGNCAAVGSAPDGSFHEHAFLAEERSGAWRRAIQVPGTSSLDAGGGAEATSVSCVSAGNCAAGGLYIDGSGRAQAFVVSETNGTWGRAIEVPGSGILNAGGDGDVGSVSCTSAGNCVAVGGYHDAAGDRQALVASETNGTWRNAIEVPGSATLNAGGLANADSVSCTTTGYCAVGGGYTDGAGRAQAYVASETNGTWANAIQIPGSATLNAGRFAAAVAVSCATAGNCAAGLTYTSDTGPQQAFVASEANRTWGTAIEIPGLSALNTGGNASIGSVSCGSAGNCAAGGTYTGGAGHTQAFVVNQS